MPQPGFPPVLGRWLTSAVSAPHSPLMAFPLLCPTLSPKAAHRGYSVATRADPVSTALPLRPLSAFGGIGGIKTNAYKGVRNHAGG